MKFMTTYSRGGTRTKRRTTFELLTWSGGGVNVPQN